MSEDREHHKKGSVCSTRPPYRNGRKLRAVKVFTIANESKFVVIQNVPSIIGAFEQLEGELSRFGEIERHFRLDELQIDEEKRFYNAFVVQFQRIDAARRCKILLDDFNFLGSILHITYAPEFESNDDFREKLNERKFIVEQKAKLKEKKSNSNILTRQQIRTRIRDLIDKSNLVQLALEQPAAKRKRIQL